MAAGLILTLFFMFLLVLIIGVLPALTNTEETHSDIIEDITKGKKS